MAPTRLRHLRTEWRNERLTKGLTKGGTCKYQWHRGIDLVWGIQSVAFGRAEDSLLDALPDMTDHEHLTWEGAWDIYAGVDGTVAEHMHMIPSSLD